MITKFEDFIAWQKARMLTKEIYTISQTGRFAKDFGRANQIQRSSVSIMANIAEGFERGRPSEFHQFLSISKSSCAEVRSHLYVALDVGYITDTEFTQLQSLSLEVANLVGALRVSVEKRIEESKK